MGGKTSTSQQTVGIPASVLSAYQSVNAKADATANNSFQDYTGNFVAPVNSQQQSAISATNTAATEAQPYYSAATGTLGQAQAGTTGINAAATGLAAASGEQVNATPLTGADINSYLSPYLGDVLGSTEQIQNQENQQGQAGQLGTAISSGAFGGDRTGLAAANLQQQEDLANSNVISGIANTGYNNALGVAQQQQGVNLAAGQANRAALGSAGSELASIGQTQYGEGANTASELGSLGTGAESAGLAGANAQLAAGTVEQQTAQAQDTAEYNQFLQQQSYPFQVDNFLASVAEGTGALSGSTTTTTQPGGFFSDRRLKHDIQKIGKTYDGQTIYSYKMHGDDRVHIGLIAQNVEKKHPEAVGLAAGYRIVDYGKATADAANRGHFYSGGIVGRRTYATGGAPYDPSDFNSIVAAQQQMYAPMQKQRDIPSQGVAGNHQLAVANGSVAPPSSGSNNLNTTIGLGQKAYQAYNHFASPSSPNMGLANEQVTNDPSMMGLQDSSMQGLQQSPQLDPNLAIQLQQAPVSTPSSGVGGAADAGATSAPTAGLAAGSAADAAAPAVAEAAAPVAADAAGTAATGAAVDAGATEAAALAAEYAAADAAVAVVAAKRGGKIRRRQGLAAGGLPYEGDGAGTPYQETDDTLNIPDVQNTNKLQTAGPLQKHPTGLQTAMTLGSEQGASSALGSMFSNQGLGSARGGVVGRRAYAAHASTNRGRFKSGGVAGRLGYDDGGNVDPAADPDVLPEQTVEGKRPVSIAYTNGADPVDQAPIQVKTPDKVDTGLGAASTDTTPKDHWWKHAENVVPLLSGLAAMGTAPTRSFGTALSAGLGAAAGSYLPAQQQEADIQSKQIQNQAAGLQLNAMRGALAPSQSSSPSVPASSPQAPISDDASVLPAYYQKKYAVAPMTAQEVARLNQAQVSGGYFKNPGLAQSIQTDIQQRIATEMFQNQQDARLRHDAAYQVATAPSGNYQMLKQADPVPAAAIAKRLGFDAASGGAPPEADAAAQQYATANTNDLHPYTGDEYKDADGQRINSRTGLPTIGAAAQQVGPAKQADLMNDAQGLVDVPQSDGSTAKVPKWRAVGAASPQAYVAQVTGGVKQPTAPQSPAPVAPPKRAMAPPPQGDPSTQSPTLPIDISKLPKIQSSPVVSGRTPSIAQNVDMEALGKEKNRQLDAASEQQALAARSNALLVPFQQKLNKINPRDVGPGSGAYKGLLELQTAITGKAPNDLVDMGVVDKFANQLGVQNVKSLLQGERITNQEMMNFLTRASASNTQPVDVMKSIIAYQKANNDYDTLASNTKTAGLLGGADPRKIDGAIETMAHRSGFVKASMDKDLGSTVVRPGQQASGPVSVASRADAMRLAPGTVFKTPDGRLLVR